MSTVVSRVYYFPSNRVEDLATLQVLDEQGIIRLHMSEMTANVGLTKATVQCAQLLSSLVRGKPDIVFCERVGPRFVVPTLIAKLTKAKLIVRLRGDFWREYKSSSTSSGFMRQLKRRVIYHVSGWIVSQANVVVPLSQRLASIASQHLGSNTTVDVAGYALSAKQRAVSSAPLPVNTPNDFVVTVSNFNYEEKAKPLAQYINRIGPILKSNSTHWLVLGNGPYLSGVKKAIDPALLRETVQFVGRQDPTPYYRHAQAHLYISGLDVLPNSVLETFHHALPLAVNSDFPAIEMLDDGNNAVILDLDDEADSLATKIHSLLNDDRVRRQLTTHASHYLGAHYTPEALAKRLKPHLR